MSITKFWGAIFLEESNGEKFYLFLIAKNQLLNQSLKIKCNKYCQMKGLLSIVTVK